MNREQELWWEQVRSDWNVYELLRQEGVEACHQLHYLQMVAEKLAKAYEWRLECPPRKSHAGFVRFLQTVLNQRPRNDRGRIAALLGDESEAKCREAIRAFSPCAHAIEQLAPALGPDANPEYPWRHDTPQFAPANYQFPEAEHLETSRGRQLLRVIVAAV